MRKFPPGIRTISFKMSMPALAFTFPSLSGKVERASAGLRGDRHWTKVQFRGERSRSGNGSAPSGQKVGVAALGKLQRPNQRRGKVIVEELAFQTSAQEVCPQEFAERCRVLGVAAALAQFAGQTAKWIVHKPGNPLRQVLVRAPPALFVKGMQPATVVQKNPEGIARQPPLIGHHHGSDLLDAL